MMKDVILLQSENEARSLLGVLDENIRRIESFIGVDIRVNAREVSLNGKKKDVDDCKNFIMYLLQEHQQGKNIDALVNDFISHKATTVENFKNSVTFHHYRKDISPRTQGQLDYLTSVYDHDVVFCIGPAGTGKTYLAMAVAVEYLKSQRVERIVLTRPAVEAGEKLGFLPGDLRAKINPYLRPLLDALYEMMDPEEIIEKMDRNIIEILPLAYMRGRTLNDAFVVLDEAQNSTPLQMKMFLTRLGFGSKMIVTGDVTQSDMPDGARSGLLDARDRLKSVKGISFNTLTENDVVRHTLVKDILRAYEKRTANNQKK